MINTIEQVNELPSGVFRATIYYRAGGTASRRILKEEGMHRFAIFRRGSRRQGSYYYSFNDDVIGFELDTPSKPDPAASWKRSWERAAKMLQESGLWTDLLSEIETGLDIGFEKIVKAYDFYWENSDDLGRIIELDPRLVPLGESGKPYLNTSIVWRMNTPAKIKKMYFGQLGRSQIYLNRIAEAMKEQKRLDIPRVIVSYDVSFEYNPEQKRAWYREEYRGCGNGHYYLALNATHALFYEDD